VNLAGVCWPHSITRTHGPGQANVEAETNEIPMFARIDLAGAAVVTADALHARRAHAVHLANTDPLLAHSAVDRFVSTTHELVIEEPSYRQRQDILKGHHWRGR
jgi:hypothetical protein